jgi:amylosucrase
MSSDPITGAITSEATASDEATAVHHRLRERLEADARAVLDDDAAHDLLERFDRRFPDAYRALHLVYGERHDLEDLLTGWLRLVLAAVEQRPTRLRRRDRAREIRPDWYHSPEMVGYVAYADRFAGSLSGVADHLDHLSDLGVTYLHLMPLLQPRPEPNDGGYAVADYRAVDERVGTVDDLRELTDTLHDRGISLCVDLVVNHTAREHAWARAARAGDPRYREYYRIFEDRTVPDRYEKTLWEVFPHLAPGNFTWDDDVNGWVWTSFHDYQWDLNYETPAVFGEMLDVILWLANLGIDVIRLDAVPFLWKRLGTSCQNLPEAHAILQAWRAFAGMAAPATIFKAEAIVGSDELVKYLGAHERHKPECELAYNNQLMVMGWSSLASRDVRLMTRSLQGMQPPPPMATWVTYVRCHDDIGWAVMDEDAAAVGISGFEHRRFLNDFYAGDFPMSFARGARFGVNPATGDARTSGSAASLVGIEQGEVLEDPELVDQGLRRLRLLHALAMSWGGIPLIWMGDEFALRNDYGYLDDPARAADNRWMHRPVMDWTVTKRLGDPGSIEARAYADLRHLIEVRRTLPMLHGAARSSAIPTDNARVFAFTRDHPVYGRFLGIANFSDVDETVTATLLGQAGLGIAADALDPGGTLHRGGRIDMRRLQVRWLVDAP